LLGHPDELPEKEELERPEMMYEARQNRLAKALRESRKGRGAGRASSLAWELRRGAGRVRKLLRSSREAE
jgi:hypothetical protein